MMVANIY